PTFGWINTKLYDKTLAETKDEFKAEQAAVGWCNQALDTNGDGKITKPFQTVPRGGFDNLLYSTDTTTQAAAAPPRGAAPAAAQAPTAAAGAAPAAGGGRGRGGAGGGGAQGAAGGRGGGRGGAPAATAATFNATQDSLIQGGGYSLYSVI